MAKRFLFLNRRAPHGSLYAQEALDAVLVAGAFDQQVSLAFVDDGVYQLLKQQDTTGIGVKDFAPAFRALADYGINTLYVERESLAERGLSAGDLLVAVTLLSRADVAELMDNQDVVLGF
jgi:tRNA 2-thiouridine synthesizing protein C